jgi:hypothetical protein
MELILKCQKALFSAYRADQYADAAGFVVSLGAVMEEFPDEVIDYVFNPKTGIQRRLKWPPALSEIVEACEEHRAFLAKQRAPRPVFQERKPEPLLRQRPQGYMAQVFVPDGHPRYAALCERAKNSDPIWWKYGNSSEGVVGIWVSHNFWNNMPDVQGAAA